VKSGQQESKKGRTIDAPQKTIEGLLESCVMGRNGATTRLEKAEVQVVTDEERKRRTVARAGEIDGSVPFALLSLVSNNVNEEVKKPRRLSR